MSPNSKAQAGQFVLRSANGDSYEEYLTDVGYYSEIREGGRISLEMRENVGNKFYTPDKTKAHVFNGVPAFPPEGSPNYQKKKQEIMALQAKYRELETKLNCQREPI
jgi:hypothetical protein